MKPNQTDISAAKLERKPLPTYLPNIITTDDHMFSQAHTDGRTPGPGESGRGGGDVSAPPPLEGACEAQLLEHRPFIPRVGTWY